MRKRKNGFTIIELLIVIAILSILAALSIPRFLHVLKSKQAAECAMSRIKTQNAEWQNVIDRGMPSQNVDELMQRGYLESYPLCPANGVYMWINEATDGNPFRNLGCSLHYFPSNLVSTSLLTPLGSTFEEISSNFIKLLTDYYNQNGKYAKSFGDYVFTDLGLNPSDWQNAVSGIIYKPVGNRLNISPAPGYVFYVNDVKGLERTLTPEMSWNLVYSLKDSSWYFHSSNPGSEINISTLRVVKK